MELLDDIGRTFFNALYDLRFPVAIGAAVAVALAAVLGWRRGWFAAARRHPARTGALVAVALAVGVPLTWYLASPIFIRTALVEPAPVIRALEPRPGHDRRAGGPDEPTLDFDDGAHRHADRDAVPADHTRQRLVLRHRRLPFRARDGDDRRDVARADSTFAWRTSRSATGPTCTSICRRRPTATPMARWSSESSRRPMAPFGYDLPAGTDPAAFAARSSGANSSATCSPSRRSRPLTHEIGKSQGYTSTDERVTSRRQTPRKRPWPERSSTQLGLLSRLTRENPMGSRRLPRGVSFSCTATRT